MNIAETILSKGANTAPAILFASTVVGYAELRQQVAQVACGLLARGHAQGDRIGIFSENSPFFVAAYLGIIRAGLVAVPLQTEIAEDTFANIVSDAGIREIFASKRLLNRLGPWADKASVELSREGGLRSAPIDEAQPQTTDHGPPTTDLAALMFTSGSTGAPKGVMVSHRNIECNSRDIIEYIGLSSQDRVMVVLPFHYCFGTSLLHTVLMAGGTLVLNNNFKLYPETVLQEMQEKECTGIAGVPSTYQILLRKSRFRQMSFPKLRWFQQAGGKLPNPCIEEIRSSFPQVKYFLMYGQTEGTARLSYLPPERLVDKLGSVGKGLPSTNLEVLKPDGTAVRPSRRFQARPRMNTGGDLWARSVGERRTEVNEGNKGETDGEVGEIVASGDNIALGYWNDPAETARFFRNGKLYTGDLARVDEDGFIFIVERERDMIKSGGNRVSAKEIEDVIAQIPEVVEVAVVGAPHELLGEAINAFVVVAPRAGLTPSEVAAHCRKRLPAFKMPEEVVFLKGMPHSDAGKVLKPKLKELLIKGDRRPSGAGDRLTTKH